MKSKPQSRMNPSAWKTVPLLAVVRARAPAQSTKTQVRGTCDANGFQWEPIGLGLGNGRGRNQVFRFCKTMADMKIWHLHGFGLIL